MMNNSSFNKYNSISNATDNDYMKKVKAKNIDKWIVAEKIHGANFSVIITDNEITYAIRENIITDYFYNYQYTMHKLENTYQRIYQYLKSEYNCKTIQIIGEFAGGGYPHPDTSHMFDKNYKLVQNGIYYAPFNFHYVFDIMVDGKYMDYIELQSICEAYRLIYSYPLFIGTLEECLNYPNDTNSALAQYLVNGFSIQNNIREGNIIRPLIESKLDNGDRIIIKHKNDKWSEISKEIDTVLLSKITGDFIENETKELLFEVSKYINSNRLANVMSKLPDNINSNTKALIGRLVSDIVKDFTNDNKKYANLETKQRKYINTKLNELCEIFINENFKLGVKNPNTNPEWTIISENINTEIITPLEFIKNVINGKYENLF